MTLKRKVFWWGNPAPAPPAARLDPNFQLRLPGPADPGRAPSTATRLVHCEVERGASHWVGLVRQARHPGPWPCSAVGAGSPFCPPHSSERPSPAGRSTLASIRTTARLYCPQSKLHTVNEDHGESPDTDGRRAVRHLDRCPCQAGLPWGDRVAPARLTGNLGRVTCPLWPVTEALEGPAASASEPTPYPPNFLTG